MTQVWINGLMSGVRSATEAKEIVNNMKNAGWYVVENWSNDFVSIEREAPKQKKIRRGV